MELTEWERFKLWLTQNSDKGLKGRTNENIRDLAIACGFNRSMVTQWETSQMFKRAS